MVNGNCNSLDAAARTAKGGRMKKYTTPKSGETEKRSPEELLGVLCKIYPPEMAREIFERLMKGMEKQNERN